MKLLICSLWIACLPIFVDAQSCLPGGITFTSQAEIDAFPQNYPGCTEIGGNLIVDELMNGDILNVDSLAQLNFIDGGLIIRNNTGITNIDGLSNITSITGSLQVESNSSLLHLHGLSSLSYIGYACHIENNDQLDDLIGFSAITEVPGFFDIEHNDGLLSLQGLENLSFVGEYFTVEENSSLISLSGLEELDTVGGLYLINCPIGNLSPLSSLETVNGPVLISSLPITEMTGLDALTHLESLVLSNLNMLTSLGTGLLGIDSVSGNVWITQNPLLQNIMGLDSLRFIGGNLQIQHNQVLESLNGLEQLVDVAGDVQIADLQMMNSFQGLNALEHIGGYLSVQMFDTGGAALIDFTGFDALQDIGGTFYLENVFELTSFNGLQSLERIEGDFIVVEAGDLIDYNELVSLSHIGGVLRAWSNFYLSDISMAVLDTIGNGIDFKNNSSCMHLKGFDALSYVGGPVYIKDNIALDSISGFNNLLLIDDLLDINTNLSLKVISGFEDLLSINGSLSLVENDSLRDIDAFYSLQSINGSLELNSNYYLDDLSAFSALESINGSLSVISANRLNTLTGLENIDPAMITNLIIAACDSLSFCSLPNICTYLGNNGPATLYNNDIGCENLLEVEFYCDPMVPPCTALTAPMNGQLGVPTDATLSWTLSPPITNGYILDIGTTPGGSEILDSFDVFNTNYYDPPFNFPSATKIFVTISPYNYLGVNATCVSDSFQTIDQASWIGGTGMWNLAANWDINAIPNDTTHVIIYGGTVTVPASYDAVAGSVELRSVSQLMIEQSASLAINNPEEQHGMTIADSALVFNKGNLRIGDLNPILQAGITISAHGAVVNDTTGVIAIDQITDSNHAALFLNGGNTSFTNLGQLMVGSLFPIQGHGINMAQASLTNGITGELFIDNIVGSSKDALHLEGGSQLMNAGDIRIGSLMPVSNYGISLSSQSDMMNDSTGIISIDRVQTGLYAFGFGATVHNYGVINIGNLGAVSASGILLTSLAEMIIDSAAFLYINQALHGISIDNQAWITNFGNFSIGSNLAISSNGINLTTGGDFYNQESGIIEINRANRAVFATGTNTWFYNYGSLEIGNVAPCNNGIQLTTSGFLLNQPTGQIEINAISVNHGVESLSNGVLSNYGSVKIGNVASITRYGISLATGGDFRNYPDAVLEIDRCLDKGIVLTNSGSLFENYAIVEIGHLAPVANIGIEMSSSANLTNTATGEMRINSVTGYAAMTMSGSPVLNNSGIITMGNETNIAGGIIAWASAKINNLTGGVLEINRIGWVSLLVDQSGTLFTNSGTFRMGNLAQNNEGISLANGGDFVNTDSGVIQANQIIYTGIHVSNSGSVFTNHGNVTIGSTGIIGYYGIFAELSGFFTNSSTGFLQINNVAPNWWSRALFLSAANFSNAGIIQIGNLTVSTSAIYMETGALFTNSTTGNIVIDQTTSAGIELLHTGTNFSNSGVITIGSVFTIQKHGIELSQGSSFVNNASGNIQVNNVNFNWWSRAIVLASGSFTNHGMISMGNLSFCAMGIGIEGTSTFVNSSSGAIQINQITSNGIIVLHPTSSFSNLGAITIGNTSTIGEAGIHALDGGVFSNGTSGVIQISRANPNWWSKGIRVANAGVFNNSGLIQLGNLASNTIGLIVEDGGSFVNLTDGVLHSANALNFAILVKQASSSFLNQGDLFVGAEGNLMENGIQVESNSSFTNDVTGSIEINKANLQWWSKSIAVISAAFTNSGSIQIGNLSLCSFGIHGEGASILNNNSSGTISINRITYQGLQLVHSGTTFNNSGLISTGSSHQVGESGIGLFENSMMTNASTGIIECNGGITSGLSAGLYVSDGSFTNNGIIRAGNISFINTGIRIGNSATEIGFFSNNGVIEIDRIPNTTFRSALNVEIGSTFVNEVSGSLKLGLMYDVTYGIYGGGTASNYGLIQTRYVTSGTVDYAQTVTNYAGGIIEVLAPGTLLIETAGTLHNHADALLKSQSGAFLRIKGVVNNYGLIDAQ